MATLLVTSSLPPLAAAEVTPTRYAAPESLGVPIQQVSVFDGIMGTEGGRAVMYTTVSGQPDAIFNVVDLVSYELLRSFPLPGSPSAWAHVVAPDGSVYIGSTKGKLYRYTPGGAVEDLGLPVPSDPWIWSLTADAQGTIYGGTYPGGKVFKYDPRTGAVTDYGQAAAGQQYARSVAYHDGYVYTGVGTAKAGLVKVNVATGEKTEIAPPAGFAFAGLVYGLDVRGRYLFVFNNTPSTLLVYDLVTGTWVGSPYTGYRGLNVSDEHDGKVYWVQNGKVVAFDLATGQASQTGISFGTYLRHASWVQVPGDPDLPGTSMWTVQFNGSVSFINFQTGKVKTRPSVLAGQPVPIQALEKGPDGKLYMSGYQGTQGAQYDTASRARANFALGQAEGIGYLGSRLFFGVYAKAEVWTLDTALPLTNPVRRRIIGSEQDRPFAITSGGNRVFIGTVPDYGKLGGALTVYDGGADTWATYRNVVQDQSVIGLAYRDGKLYGSTSVWGGLGATPTASEARVFVWDVASGTKVAEVAPAIAGVAAPKAIGQLSFGPDGKLWGAAQGTLFVMDPDTLQVERSRAVFPSDWAISHYWRPVYLRWAPDGMLYATLRSKLVAIDPETLESVQLADTPLMTVGDDGDLYYATGASLTKIDVAYPFLLSSAPGADGFTLSLRAEGAKGIEGGRLTFAFDASRYEVVGAEAGSGLAGRRVTYDHGQDGKLEVNIVPGGKGAVLTGDGELLTLQFRLRAGAPAVPRTQVKLLSGQFHQEGAGKAPLPWPLTHWVQF